MIAFSPVRDIDEHRSRFDFPIEAFSEFRFVPSDFEFAEVRGACLKLRNVYCVTFSDVVVLIRGKTGTLNEFTIAYDLRKAIGVLKGSGGVSDSIPQLVEMLQKPSGAVFVHSEDPIFNSSTVLRFRSITQDDFGSLSDSPPTRGETLQTASRIRQVVVMLD